MQLKIDIVHRILISHSLHLATSEMWCWSGVMGILIKLSLCYSTVYRYNSCTMVWAVLTGWLTGLGFDLAWFSSLSSKHLCIFGLNGDICIPEVIFLVMTFLYLLMSWAWWDWLSTWLTNHSPSVLWHCWLVCLNCKIILEMTYNVSSGTSNPTILSSFHQPPSTPHVANRQISTYADNVIRLLNDSIFVPLAAIYSLFHGFSSICTAVAPSRSLDQRHGTCYKTICVIRTCKLTVFVVHWRRVFFDQYSAHWPH